MKVLTKNYKHGFIELIPENLDDLYAIYRILKTGDKLRAGTTRRIRKDAEDSRPDRGERVKMTLEIEIEDFTLGDNLSVKGTIIDGNQDLISLGSYHTIALSPMEKARITKEEWNATEKKIIEEMEKSSMLAQILIITLDEGSVCVALVTQFSVKIVTEYSSGITRKFSDAKQHSSSMGNFFQEVYQIIKDALGLYEPQTIILAGPGFTPENFMEFIRKRDQPLSQQIQFVHSNTGGRVGLHEVLSRNLPEKIAEEQRVVYETRLLEEFFKRIGQDAGTITYGLENVRRALEMGAIDTLMIADSMIRTIDVKKRQMIDEIVETNEQMRGKTVFMSSMHETGEQLDKLGGIAALLRYPISEV